MISASENGTTLGERLRHYVLTGLFVTVPIGLTVLVIVWFVSFVDYTVAPILDTFVGRHIPGLGLLTAFVFVVATGWLADQVAGQTFLDYSERVMLRIPGFNWVYRTIKQIIDAFSPDNKVAFRRVVLVEYPRSGILSIGFVTKELETELEEGAVEKRVAVYIPTNHFYLGDYVLVRPDAVFETQMSVQQGIQCCLSAGAALPQRLTHKGGRQ